MEQCGQQTNVVATASPFLRAKLRRPVVPEYFVERPRLHSILDGAVGRPLTLVIAPAGSGKTQLLSSWVERREMPTAWLSLDQMDDDPVELWTAVVAALRTFLTEIRAALEVMSARAPAVEVVAALLDELDVAGVADAVLVLDDTHHLRSEATVESLVLFIQHLPSWLHVVIAGRADPQLPLSRMRVRDQLVEVRFADMRLRDDEAREMLVRLAPNLADGDVAASVERSDGWAAGLQLAALSARHALADEGSSRRWRNDTELLITDYVWQEILGSGDTEVVEALMQLSVVDRFDTALAVAITGDAGVRATLLRGEAAGLFVHRLGGDWFRIHPLVRDALLAELRRRGTDRALHERAARRLEDSGETPTALEQWLLAGRPREALRVLSQRSTELYDRGREALIARTLEAIPPEVVSADVPALIDFAVASIVFGPRATFVETVGEARRRAQDSEVDHVPQLDALHAIASTMTGDWTGGLPFARRALSALGTSWSTDPAGRFAWNVLARGVALSERWDDDDAVVVDATNAMRHDPRRGIALEGIRALGHALAGRPVDALRIAAGVRPAAATMTILRAEVALAEAIARRELGDRARALGDLAALAELADEPRLFCPVGARLELVAVALDDGDVQGAAAQLDRAEQLVASAAAGPDLRDWVARAAVAVSIASGSLDEAARRAAAMVHPFWAPTASARVALADGEQAAAADHLGRAVPTSPRHEVILALLLARAATSPDAVAGRVAEALGTASEHGMLQTVATESAGLIHVIERAAWRVPPEWLSRLRSAMAPTGLVQRVPTRDLPETLTDREREVLRLLPSRLTLAEIANELYVSPNTVKFHLRVIYRKLGVNSREAAAEVACSLTQPALR